MLTQWGLKLAAVALISMLFIGTASSQMEITSEDVGFRVQYAHLRFNDRDWGWDPIFSGYYDVALDPWVFGGMLSSGSGWDFHVTRWEGQLTAGYRVGPVFFAGGWHFVNMDSKNYPSAQWNYHGPEFLANGGYTFGDTDVSVYGNATLLPYLFTSYKDDINSKETGDTWGYTLDGGISYKFWEFWRIAAGYRFLQIEDIDAGAGSSQADRLHGPYVEACFIW